MEHKKTFRADAIIRKQFPILRSSLVEEAFALKLIVGSDGKALAKGAHVKADASLNVEKLVAAISEARSQAQRATIPILHREAEWLAIDKPAGIPGHPLHLRDRNTVTQWAFDEFPETRERFPEVQPTLTPHRLDIGTSGILIVALTPAAYEEWRRRFSAKQVEKVYQAWCWGKPGWAEREISLEIGHDPKDRTRMRAKLPMRPPILPALTHLKVLDQRVDRFHCEVRCQTGVTHQVRVHLATEGFPLLGDPLYDPDFESRPEKPPYHALRACELRFGDLLIRA